MSNAGENANETVQSQIFQVLLAIPKIQRWYRKRKFVKTINKRIEKKKNNEKLQKDLEETRELNKYVETLINDHIKYDVFPNIILELLNEDFAPVKLETSLTYETYDLIVNEYLETVIISIFHEIFEDTT
eukprot:UN03110